MNSAIRRASLLVSVTLVAPFVGAAASAEDPPRFPDWYFSAEGGALFAAPSVSTSKLDGSSVAAEFGTNIGGYGAATLGGAINSNNDWRMRLGYAAFNNSTRTDEGDVDPRLLTSRVFLETADFDLGFQRALKTNDYRAFVGLRGLAVSEGATEDKVGSPPPDSVLSTEFIGIGPRVGLGFAHTVAGSPWGVSGSVAGSAVFGQRTVVGQNTTTVASGTVTILNADATLGVDYRTSPSGVLTLGVRGEQWWNVRPAYQSSDLTVKSDLADWGLFVRWTFRAP